ncbi:MAG: hypothetical protein PHV30_02355 [Candidatus Margulisbacteria bacterium]|nr:hypothetical protein [Candidatus Margulisiibacteriota bacterium]
MPKDKHFLHSITFLILVAAFLLTGCAEMVSSPKTSAGNVLNFNVNFRDQYNIAGYRYIFVYSKQPLNFPVNYYLFVPGDIGIESQLSGVTIPDPTIISADDKINYYYQNYFSTWSDDIVMDSSEGNYLCFGTGNYFPVTANAVIHNSIARNSLSNTSFQFNSSSKYANGFYFQISLSALRNPPAAGDTFYFNLLVLDKDRKLVDTLQTDLAVMTNDLNQIKTGGPTNYAPVSGNLDIIAWEARIL